MVAGAQIKISKDGIEFIGQTITHKADRHIKQGGESVRLELPAMPNANTPSLYSASLDAYSHLSALTANAKYTALLADGRHVKGMLNEQGVSNAIYSKDAGKTKILAGSPKNEWDASLDAEPSTNQDT